MAPDNIKALPAAREQWQRCDWASLVSLTLDELQDHPDRAKLVLLPGIGQINIGDMNQENNLTNSQKLGALTKTNSKLPLRNTHAKLSECLVIAGKRENVEKHDQISINFFM